MATPGRSHATNLLDSLCEGEDGATEHLMPLVYGELRAIAGALLKRERGDHTLQPTALVHEAWLRLIDQRCLRSDDTDARRRFVGLAAHTMRQVLVDHARSRGREKRVGRRERMPLSEGLPIAAADPALLLDLESALVQLEARGERLARVAELRLFGGVSAQEIAETLQVSPSTARADWALAQALLTRFMQDGDRSANAEVP